MAAVNRPVFTDDSGTRALVMTSTGRLVCLISVLVATALAVTLTSHVPLPLLDRPTSSLAELLRGSRPLQPPTTLSKPGPDAVGGPVKPTGLPRRPAGPNVVLKPAARPVAEPLPKMTSKHLTPTTRRMTSRSAPKLDLRRPHLPSVRNWRGASND